jgi:hypothetical protein
VPLQAGVPNPPGLKSPAELRKMSVDFSTAAASWDTVAQFLEAEFAAGD